MGLVGAVVRILTDDDDFDGIERCVTRPMHISEKVCTRLP